MTMGGLTKRVAAGELRYVCVHPYWVRSVLIDRETGDEVEESTFRANDDVEEDLIAMATAYVNDDIEFMSGLFNEQVPGVGLTSIEFDGTEVTWNLTADHELSEEECAQLGDYILGQCSDGLGEGLEQQEVDGDREDVEVEYEDEETGDYGTEYHDGRWYHELHMWDPDMDTPRVEKVG